MKLLKVMLAVLVMAAMAVPVIAEDRLTLSGEMRVRGWHKDFSFDNFTNSEDEKVKDPDDTETWGDQRLRVGGKIAVAEGVSITFRTDITESNWGTTGGGNGFGSGRSGSNQQWDRAHIDLTKGAFHLRAGQQYKAYGKTYALDSQDNGISVDYKFGDVPVNAFFLVNDDNGSRSKSDAFLVGAKVSPKFDNVAVNAFVGNQTDGSEESVTLIGADVTIPLDAFKIVAELDFFTGDSTSKNVDAYGTQFMLDGSMAVSDAVTLGGTFYYGAGDDEDMQYTNIGNGFGGWDPVMDVGTSLSNEQIKYGSPFNIASIQGYEGAGFQATSAGSVGGRLYGDFKASDALKLGATAGYFQSEEDKIADIEVLVLAGGLVYNLMANTTFHFQIEYTDGTVNKTDYTAVNGDIDFDNFRMGTGLYVKF
ncbi:MAG: hypothetical protein JRC99_05775 [Deltaproteobacteria bacterium]|nr:hypothetical protein [Deltaproteobacteria bacterium]